MGLLVVHIHAYLTPAISGSALGGGGGPKVSAKWHYPGPRRAFLGLVGGEGGLGLAEPGFPGVRHTDTQRRWQQNGCLSAEPCQAAGNKSDAHFGAGRGVSLSSVGAQRTWSTMADTHPHPPTLTHTYTHIEHRETNKARKAVEENSSGTAEQSWTSLGLLQRMQC